jgi:hypothetical protein
VIVLAMHHQHVDHSEIITPASASAA